jgi:N-acyl-D-aspartate/D-glutamate deacylase
MINTKKNYHTIIKNASVIDGTGQLAFKTHVGIKEQKMTLLANLSDKKAEHYVEAEGLILSPGFIDVHTHDDLEVLRNPTMLSKLSQGVTTSIIGNCGISASPYIPLCTPPDPINLLGKSEEFTFSSLEEYIAAFNKVSPSINVAALVGHTTLRAQVMHELERSATPEELISMCKALKMALEQGAIGLSSGLAYRNAICAPTDEIQKLANELAPFNAIYTTHLRTEFDDIIHALDEAFITSKKAKVPLVISHVKCAGKNNWGRSTEVIEHIKNAQLKQNVSCDCYPYNASSSTLDLKQVTTDFTIDITWSDPHPEMAGKTLADIANQWQLSLLLAAEKLQPAGAVYHGINEKDVANFIAFPSSMIGSDGLPCDPHPHPRLWGSFPRVLGHYSRDNQLLTLEQAIHKMTGLSAKNFNLKKRGVIADGHYADLVLFDPIKIKDKATFKDPIQLSEGIHTVWVNGQLSFSSQSNTQLSSTERSGKFLKHN